MQKTHSYDPEGQFLKFGTVLPSCVGVPVFTNGNTAADALLAIRDLAIENSRLKTETSTLKTLLAIERISEKVGHENSIFLPFHLSTIETDLEDARRDRNAYFLMVAESNDGTAEYCSVGRFADFNTWKDLDDYLDSEQLDELVQWFYRLRFFALVSLSDLSEMAIKDPREFLIGAFFEQKGLTDYQRLVFMSMNLSIQSQAINEQYQRIKQLKARAAS